MKIMNEKRDKLRKEIYKIETDLKIQPFNG